MLEHRFDRKAFPWRPDFNIQAPSSEPSGLFLCVFEFAPVFVQVQDARRTKIVANAGIASQLAQLLLAVQRKYQRGFGVAKRPTWQTFKEEAQTPKPLGEVGARPEEQRCVFAPQPLQDLEGGGRVGPRLGLTDRDLATIGEARLERGFGLAVHHRHFVAALREIPRAGRTDDSGPENNYPHTRLRKNKRGKACAFSPLPCPSPVSERLRVRVFGSRSCREFARAKTNLPFRPAYGKRVLRPALQKCRYGRGAYFPV